MRAAEAFLVLVLIVAGTAMAYHIDDVRVTVVWLAVLFGILHLLTRRPPGRRGGTGG